MAETTKKPASAETKATKAAAPKKAAVKSSSDPVAEKNVAEKSSSTGKAAVSIKAAKTPKKTERTSGLRVTQIASGGGKGKTQIATLQGLGLGKIRRSKILADTPEIRGMCHSLKHLVKMEVVG